MALVAVAGAARNAFRVAIAPAREAAAAAEQSFTWEAGEGQRELRSDVAELRKAGLAGRFEARLYADGRFVLKRDFAIKD